MNKVFKFPPQSWLRIGAVCLIILLLTLILLWARSVLISIIIIPGIIAAAWGGVSLLHRALQQVVLTDNKLIVKGWFRTRQVAYQDIYYVRTSGQAPPQLTLITLKGPIHLDKRLLNYRVLYQLLEDRVPAVLTPNIVWVPLPFRVTATVSNYVFGIGMTLFLWSIGVTVGIAGLAETSLGLLFLSIVALGMGGVLLYALLQAPYAYFFTADEIVKYAPLREERYLVADLKAMYHERVKIKTKQGIRLAPQAVFRFENDRELIIKSSEISYPFSEFNAIIQYHYNPRSRIEIPWKREQHALSHTLFATGSVHEFEWYFTGESAVAVASVDDICQWLQGCVYVSDRQLFLKDDVWQHPVTFEQIRKGDCEDHALWAWRKLIELDIEAEFVVGKFDGGGHAWIMFERDEQQYLLEAVHKGKDIILPIAQTTEKYTPRYSIDRNLVTYQYEMPSP